MRLRLSVARYFIAKAKTKLKWNENDNEKKRKEKKKKWEMFAEFMHGAW